MCGLILLSVFCPLRRDKLAQCNDELLQTQRFFAIFGRKNECFQGTSVKSDFFDAKTFARVKGTFHSSPRCIVSRKSS